ncbi:MAG: hypothetical protein ACREX3_05840 [Gammaproteobacteria bacterium]
MNLMVTKAGPDPWEWERVPVVARREDVERVAALNRQALNLLREAEAMNLGGRGGLGEELVLDQLECDVVYYERLLQQPGEFIVVSFEVEEDDPESPAILERQRQRNAAIGANDFVPPGGLDYVLGAEH